MEDMMSDNLIKLLTRLNEIAPEVCRQTTARYIIGDYGFWFDGGGELVAEENQYQNAFLHPFTRGGAALAWLQTAAQQAIGARGWYWSAEVWSDGVSIVKIWKTPAAINYRADGNPLAEALLSAFVAALETER